MKREDETIERVLLNQRTGQLGLGIRVRFHDKYHSEDLALGPCPNGKGYTLRMEPAEFDCWALFSGADDARGPWMLVPGADFTYIEDMGPL